MRASSSATDVTASTCARRCRASGCWCTTRAGWTSRAERGGADPRSGAGFGPLRFRVAGARRAFDVLCCVATVSGTAKSAGFRGFHPRRGGLAAWVAAANSKRPRTSFDGRQNSRSSGTSPHKDRGFHPQGGVPSRIPSAAHECRQFVSLSAVFRLRGRAAVGSWVSSSG
ncbi:hypothetical protein [Lysobacter gummosus]|uniref:hypothetical protein n=1 Tax=Lysobacter gummosus TaxID=262324 RepID=UPI00363BBCEC